MFVPLQGRWSVALLGLALLPTVMPAAPAPIEPQAAPKGEQIRKALEQTITLEMGEVGLPQVLDQLREQTKVNFVIDKNTVSAMGLEDSDLTVTVNVRNIKVRSALRTIVGPLNLGYAIVGDTVVITSEEMALYRQVRQPVNVDLQQVPLQTALRQLARETATNLVVDPRVTKEAQSPVTLSLADVPLEVAVRLMAEVAGLKPVRLGNVLFVTTKANAAELRADPDNATPPLPNAGQATTGEGPALRLGAGKAILPAPNPPAPPPAALPGTP